MDRDQVPTNHNPLNRDPEDLGDMLADEAEPAAEPDESPDTGPDQHDEGPYLSCMQCGYMKDVDEEDPSIRARVRIPEETGKQPIAS